jgi:soluble lytic murein transglycosylase
MGKFRKWEIAIQNPSDYLTVFTFFYNNPHWPEFEKSVKEAEKNIPHSPRKIPFLVKWFERHPPMTGAGIIAYAHCLLKTNREMALEYIKQVWILQNITDSLAEEFREEFGSYLTPLDDARRAKRLMDQNKVQQLIAMRKITTTQIAGYIDRFLRQKFADKASGYSANDLRDPQKRLNIVQGLIDRKQITKAAKILVMTNRLEEQYPKAFYSQRRYVAYEILRSGDPKLAYQLANLCKLQPGQSSEDYVKIKWLSGFIAFRFLKDYDAAIEHFEAAYNNSRAAIRLSKNACWLAEVHRANNDIVLAVDWYKKAALHFNTFYGYVAHHRLSGLPNGRFSVVDDVYTHDFAITPTNLEVRFYGRELVQVLMEISKNGVSKKNVKYFYLKLISDIDDSNEELLLFDIAKANDDLDLLIPTISKKQHFPAVKRAYKILDDDDITHVQRVETASCFKAIVHAVIHSESNFNENAVSYVGAVGLMQIMPTTAIYEMTKIKFYIGKGVPLANREKNLLIGSSILSRLLKKYDGNIVFVIAAYNCGEGNVSKFQKSIKNLKNLSYIDLMELIPYKETRIYLKHVLRALFAYQDTFGAGDCYRASAIANFETS